MFCLDGASPDKVRWPLLLRASLSLRASPPFKPNTTIMAIARPIRMLGAACILLCLFLVFQLHQSSSEEGSKLAQGMKKDPLVDRA